MRQARSVEARARCLGNLPIASGDVAEAGNLCSLARRWGGQILIGRVHVRVWIRVLAGPQAGLWHALTITGLACRQRSRSVDGQRDLEAGTAERRGRCADPAVVEHDDLQDEREA